MGGDSIGRDDGIKALSDEDTDIGIPVGGVGGDRENEDSPKGRKRARKHNEREAAANQ